jgi:uncharacterized protein YjbI with pentapeptide repeats
MCVRRTRVRANARQGERASGECASGERASGECASGERASGRTRRANVHARRANVRRVNVHARRANVRQVNVHWAYVRQANLRLTVCALGKLRPADVRWHEHMID